MVGAGARRRPHRRAPCSPLAAASSWSADLGCLRRPALARRGTAPRCVRMKRSAASSPPSRRARRSALRPRRRRHCRSGWRRPRAPACRAGQRREAELAADLGAGLARDQRIVAARQIAFGLVREALVEPARDDKAEHPVAEEFEPLVAVAAPRLRMGRAPARTATGPWARGRARSRTNAPTSAHSASPV